MNLIAATAVAATLVSVSVPADAAPKGPPRRPHIVDQAGDANYLHLVDQPTPTSRPEGDLLGAWFSSDKKVLTVTWHLAASPVDQGLALDLNAVPARPDVPEYRSLGKGRCMFFQAVFPRPTDPYDPYGFYGNHCESPDFAFPARPVAKELPDGSALVSIRAKIGGNSAIRSRDVLSKPWADIGHYTLLDYPVGYFVSLPRIDQTPVGRDYTVP